MSFDVIVFGKDCCERVYDHIINNHIQHDEAGQLKQFKGKDIQRTPTQKMDSPLNFNEEIRKGKKERLIQKNQTIRKWPSLLPLTFLSSRCA